jgi:Glu-tRNA(Gln) amidotransferase subunit E-like FAD-binding protein
VVNPIPVKIICRCGQKYAFDVQPVHGRMPVPIFCPTCGLEGTVEANQVISRILHGKTQPLPPLSVATVLTAVQSELAPHLVEALKDAVVQELAGQRRELLAAQQAAAAELTELARRLEAAQTPLLERLRAYEQRISELEKMLSEQSKENHELLKLKIEMIRSQIQTEREHSRINFN